MSTQQITTVLDSMRNLGNKTGDILDLVTAQKSANEEAIRQMNAASELIGRLMGGRLDLETILETSTRTKEDQAQQVQRITEALNNQPTVGDMQTAITQLQTAISGAQQAGVPGGPGPGGPTGPVRGPVRGPTGPTGPVRGPTGPVAPLPAARGVQPVNNAADRGGPAAPNLGARRGGMRGGYYYSGSPVKTQKKYKSRSLTPKSRRKKSGRRK